MNKPGRPDLVIVAGPNGAGKSTVAEFLLHNRSIVSFVNADVIARGLSAQNVEGSDIHAGRIMVERLRGVIAERESVAFESTMAGLSWNNLLRRSIALGFETTICYVALDSPERAVERVRQRVGRGGHDIPVDTVRRRFERSLRLFFSTYRHSVDNWYFFDNSAASARLLALSEGGVVQVVEGDRFSFFESTYG